MGYSLSHDQIRELVKEELVTKEHEYNFTKHLGGDIEKVKYELIAVEKVFNKIAELVGISFDELLLGHSIEEIQSLTNTNE
ncbi:hypothetical protein BUZ51_02145 [Staphylococcus hominis]|uniref:Uncharacterized protein n=1 Tax=Staphylococcus hominis TaxID=1290 RepID=A0A974QPA3_STAHO|nr:hypothetical protein [Staphylococcus hominis]PTK31892.1 hypothetical protein BUZ51_02145 [Staphylococcus hominis]